ncbi:hypothetical protein P886_4464 [Alteromonadaceae bacterium 2753L.S.0a.02]|nr:hypothetical protein P886_4464 [Alteromonadaceae bacterium 2753L.S.0a.02]
MGAIDDHLSLSACAIADHNAVDKAVWKGEYIEASTGDRLTNSASSELHHLVIELKRYFQTESMGVWNLMLYKLAAYGKSFSIDFEFNEELESGNTSLYHYRKRFERPKQ